MVSILPDEPSAEERLEQLPQDNGTPFRPADDNEVDNLQDGSTAVRHFDDTHPSTDTNLQPEEIYDEGYAGAAEVSEPNADSSVQGYDPARDQRRQAEEAGRNS